MSENSEHKKLLDEGIFAIQDGDFEKAIKLITDSIKIKNDWEISYFYRAVAHQSLKNFNDAMLDYTKSVKLNPKMTDAYYNMAKITLEKEKITENEILNAIENLNKALELDENFIDALFAMAAAQKKIKNYNESLKYLEKLLEIEPQAIHARALKKLLLQKYIV